MFNVKFSEPPAFPVDFAASENFDAEFDETVEKPVGDFYEGEYEFTPADADQVISIAEKVAARDIVIRAIPSSYGHIQYNGGYLYIY